MTTPLDELLASLPREQVLKISREPLAWAEALLLAPSTNEPFVANYVQHQILRSPHRYNIIRVHRRAGKSFSMAILALFYCLMFEGIQVLLICPRGSQVNEIFLTIKDFIHANPWIEAYLAGSRQALPQQIRFHNGSRVTGFTTGAKGGAAGIRGQGADVVLVDEGAYVPEDAWGTINPIMQGDVHRRWPPKVYIASTPAATRGHYYELCTNPHNALSTAGVVFWNQVHVPITTNPGVTEAFRAECRALCASELDWIREYLCEFPEIGEGVFPKRLVDASRFPIVYAESLRDARTETAEKRRPPSRTLGVDWDKFNKDGRGPNLIVLEATEAGKQRVIYREEIPQSDFSLSNGVLRIIELNELFQPEWIFVDRGYGDHQIEELQLYGRKFPGSGLAEKVVGIQFGQNVEQPLPGGGIEKKRFKQVMVQLLRGWFERGRVETALADDVLYKELIEYHVVGQTDANLKFSDENDHAIAALGLAAMAMHTKVKNPYTPPAASRCYIRPAPISIPKSELERRAAQTDPFRTQDTHPHDRRERSFSRRRLGGGGPFSRSSF